MQLPVALRRTNSQIQIVRRSFSTEQRLASRWPIRLRKIVRPAAEAETKTAPQRHVLPQNLRHAVRQLNDGELDELFGVAFDEAKRRGRLPRSFGTDSTPFSRRPSDLVTKRSPPTHKRRQVDIDEVPMTRGQLNAVRAVFKAGITPSRIARQFRISQANMRKALASDEPRR
jgi:hypothetical protein